MGKLAVIEKKEKIKKPKKEFFVKRIINAFKEGSVFVKLSFLFSGTGNIKYKQYTKGILFLLLQLCGILFFAFFGVKAIGGLITLGTNEQGWIPDPDIGEIYVKGDNSMIMLIYGIASIFLLAVFFLIYITGVKSSIHVEKLHKSNKKIPTAKEDFFQLFDSKFHSMLLTVPIIGILTFTIIPLVYMVLVGFTNYDATHLPPGKLFNWVGLKNFYDLLFGFGADSTTLWTLLGWTVIWAIIATFSNYFLGIMLAMAINRKATKFKRVYRTIFVLTIAIPQFISLLVMRNMLDKLGPINELLIKIGLIDNSTRINFLGDTRLHGLIPKITVLIVNLWVGIPYTMLITTGILMNIPKELTEAAAIDGASPFKIFARIVMPYVLFVTAPYLITQFIGNINNFNLIYLLTAGGPTDTALSNGAGRTDLLITWLYKLTVDKNNYKLASTIGMIIFILTASISLVAYSRTSSMKKEEDFQ